MALDQKWQEDDGDDFEFRVGVKGKPGLFHVEIDASDMNKIMNERRTVSVHIPGDHPLTMLINLDEKGDLNVVSKNGENLHMFPVIQTVSVSSSSASLSSSNELSDSGARNKNEVALETKARR